MTREQAADDRIQEWLHEEGSGQLPDWVLTTTFERTRTQRQRRTWSGWRFPMTFVLRRSARAAPGVRASWILILAAILALALVGGALVVGSRMLSTTPPDNGPLAVAMPPTACPAGTQLKGGDIATIAGTGTAAPYGDGGPAIAADVGFFDGGSVAIDSAGAFYFSQNGLSIRRVGPDGIISTVAGPSKVPPFVTPTGVAADGAGNLYVADMGWIWKLEPTGNVTPYAGLGYSGGPSGDGGPALYAEINAYGALVLPSGDLIIDDYQDANVQRRIDAAGIIHRFSGNGLAGSPLGDGGPATEAGFGLPVFGSAADRFGNVYLTDDDHFRIRKVDPSGTITTFAGTGTSGYSGDRGPATDAMIGDPRGMAVDDAGNVYFADDESNVVRKVDTAGIITTIAGTGKAGFAGDCGPALNAQFRRPIQLAIHDGLMYIVDIVNGRVRVMVL
jgi:hypothetical protein